MRHTLVHLDDARVVAVHAFARLPHRDGAELRERPQQLGPRRRRVVAERGARKRRVAEERVRHRLVEDGCPEREVLRVELVDVDRRVDRSTQREMIAARADIAHRHREAASQLALHVD